MDDFGGSDDGSDDGGGTGSDDGGGDGGGYSTGEETDDENYEDDEDDLTPGVRSAAAECAAAICKLPGVEGLSVLLPKLVEQIKSEYSTEVRKGLYKAVEEVCAQSDPQIVAELVLTVVSKEFEGKSQTRVEAIEALRALAAAHPGCFSQSLAVLGPGLFKALKSTKDEVRVSALMLLGDLAGTTEPGALQECLGPLCAAVAAGIGSGGRTGIEGCKQVQKLAAVTQPAESAVLFDTAAAAVQPSSVAELRQAAIGALAALVATKGLGDKLSDFMSSLAGCLDDEATRLAGIQATIVVCQPSLGLTDGATINKHGISGKLVSFITESNKNVAEVSMSALGMISMSYPGSLDDAAIVDVVSTVISESEPDLQLSSGAVSLCASLLAANGDLMAKIKPQLWPTLLKLSSSP